MNAHVWSNQTWNPVGEDVIVGLIESARFVTWYDTIRTTVNDISTLDLAIPAFLDAVPNFKMLLSGADGRDLRDVLAEASSLLKHVPEDTDLWDWQIDELALKSLFQATTGGLNGSLPGFGPAKCTKLLHRMRPRAIPIIDSWIRAEWSANSSGAWTTDEMVAITKQMQSELRPRTLELELVRSAILRRWSVEVSLLRAYDILSYLWHSERRSGSTALD